MAESIVVPVVSTKGVPDGVIAETPEGMPNLVVKTVHPARRLFIRTARVFVQSLTTFLPASIAVGQLQAIDEVIPFLTTFVDQIIVGVVLAAIPAIGAFLTNLSEILANADK